MSDFLFTRDKQALHQLAQPLRDLMPEPVSVKVKEYSGSWGALTVSLGPYNGFDPYEDEAHICIVIGGPVLYWRNNHFLTDPKQSTVATQAILKHWQNGKADWSEDLSGPFVIFIINKKSGELFCYTDLLMFIPVYQYANSKDLCLGTHVDALAEVCKQKQNMDEVSIVDFILHNIVTYPYTVYSNLFQLAPATEHKWSLDNNKNMEQRSCYWEPLETNPYDSIVEAAMATRKGLTGYINRVTESMTEVGHFISGGEDSRSVAGLLPKRLKRHAYIYIDSRNREFRLAKQVSEIYDCKFHYIFRSPKHYLDILPDASKLVGGGQQYTHAHTLNLIKQSGADKHFAVFGGFISDTLLKAPYRKRYEITRQLPFLPEFFVSGSKEVILGDTSFFDQKIINKIKLRRLKHFEYIRKIRPQSTYEWFSIWPMTMHETIPNISVNRRLYPSYEVFTSKEVVKIAAASPVQWKLNRRLFNRIVKPSLKASKWIPHADGRLPYFPWYFNSFLQIPFWSKKKFESFSGKRVNDGSWTDWNSVTTSSDWLSIINLYISNAEKIDFFESGISVKDLLLDSSLYKQRKVNLLQILYHVESIDRK